MSNMKLVSVGLMVSVLGLVGCNNIRSIGMIGDTEYQAVRSTDLFGPSSLTVVSVERDGTQNIVGSFGSDGAFPSLVGAAGDVVAAEVYDGDNHNTNVSGSVNVKQNNGRRGPLSDQPPL